MKKFFASLIFIAYLGFSTSVFIHTHHQVHAYVCNEAGNNLLITGLSEANENYCNHSLPAEKLKLSAQRITHFYTVVIPGSVIIARSNFETSIPQAPGKFYYNHTAPVTPIGLYIKNRVLLI